MSRHNRRRSRGGRKHASPSRNANMAVMDDSLSVAAPSVFSYNGSEHSRASTPSSIPDFVDRVPRLPPRMPLAHSNAPNAKVWHNRYVAWQSRVRAEQVAVQRASADLKCGGPGLCPIYPSSVDPGTQSEPDLSDDEANELDAKMLNYFEGLDWLE